jgi:hypothetical protein
LAAGRKAEPTAAIIYSRTLRSTPESGERAGYDGGKRKKVRKSKWRSTRWATCSRSM